MKAELERRHPRHHHAVQRRPERRPRLPRRPRALDGGRGLHRPRAAGLAGRGRDAVAGREAPGARDLRARGGRARARRPRHRRARHERGGGARARRRSRSAAAASWCCRPTSTARDWREMKAHVAAVARARPTCRACSTTTPSPTAPTSRPSRSPSWPRELPEPRGRQGVEHGRAPRDRHPRAAGRPAGRAGRASTTRSSRASRRARSAGSRGS